MSTTYFMRFGSGDPRNSSGLAPTFLIFRQANGSDVTPPSITEVGSTFGVYTFTWGTTTAIAFLADGATSGLSSGRYVVGALDPVDRVDQNAATLLAFSTTLVAIGTTNFALGTSSVALGTTAVAIGTSLVSLGVTGIALGTTAVALGTSNIALGTTILNWVSGTSSPLLPFIGSTASSFGDNTQDPVDLFGYLKRIQENLEGTALFTKGSGAWDIKSRGGSLLATRTVSNGQTTVVKS